MLQARQQPQQQQKQGEEEEEEDVNFGSPKKIMMTSEREIPIHFGDSAALTKEEWEELDLDVEEEEEDEMNFADLGGVKGFKNKTTKGV